MNEIQSSSAAPRALVEEPVAARARSAIEHAGPIAAFAAAFLLTLIVAMAGGEKPFYYDAALYWKLGGSFVRDGHFSLLNFDDALRGYAYPLVNRELMKIAEAFRSSASTIVRISNALLFALIGAVLVPRLAEATWPDRRWGFLRRMLLTAVLLVFWRGYMSYPLSDFPALCMVLLALIAIARPYAPGWMLLAGIAAGLAIDIRPEYVVLGPILLLLVAWAWLKREPARPRFERGPTRPVSVVRRLLCCGLLLVGFAAVSLPQSLASHRHQGTWSFLPGSAAGLTYTQLTDGMLLQRYETYVGPGPEPSNAPAMYYLDPSGKAILEEQPTEHVESLGQYVGIVESHPFTIANLFVHHFVNGLDARYDTPYVEHLGSKILPRLAGFLLVFLALVRVLWPTARRGLSPTRWRYQLALLGCCATTLSSAMETRFLLPMYMLVYMLVLAPGWSSLREASFTHPQRYRRLAIIGASCAGFLLCVWLITNNATNNLRILR